MNEVLPTTRPDYIDERGWNIVCAREAGVHRADLARRHGISLNRVYQIERVTRRRIHEREWQQRINADLIAEQAALMAEDARLKEQAQQIRQRRQAIQERLEAIGKEMRHRLQLRGIRRPTRAEQDVGDCEAANA